jgi:hypothetical protein
MMIRIAERFGKPTSVLDERCQWTPAAAAKWAARIRAATPEAPVEDRAAVALEQPSESELAMRAQFWKQNEEFFRQLKALSPSELAKFFDQYLAPLPIAGELKPKNADHISSI